jgi:DNA mismatch repair protein MutS
MKEEVTATCDLLWDSVRAIHSQWTEWLGSIDVTFALASAALEYKWTKPSLGDSLEVKGLRHPLLELASTRAEYVKHSVSLGSSDEPSGMLLYGVNASGKSSLMKALGISVLLAQAGSFVPADSFTLRPYDAAFSRIWSHDNVWAGLSSFAVEVGELRDILQLATERSLVLGDEVCSGTESISATALVASTLEHLDGLGAHFIFATHLHDLLKVPGLLPRPGIGVWHLRVLQDASGKLIYDRTLQSGSGNSSYGLEVAKAMGLPLTLMQRAYEIRKTLEGSVHLSEAPRSSWNTQIARERCEVCGSQTVNALEVHHITPRSEGGSNTLRNLVVLCERCHDDHHRGDLSIGELRQTSEGLERETVRTEATTPGKSKTPERSVEEIETITTTLERFKGRPVARLVSALEQSGISMTPAEVKKWVKKG